MMNATLRRPQQPLLRFGCAPPAPGTHGQLRGAQPRACDRQCGDVLAIGFYIQPYSIPQPVQQQHAAQACIVRAAGGMCAREACVQCHPRMVIKSMWPGGPAPATRGAPCVYFAIVCCGMLFGHALAGLPVRMDGTCVLVGCSPFVSASIL